MGPVGVSSVTVSCQFGADDMSAMSASSNEPQAGVHWTGAHREGQERGSYEPPMTPRLVGSCHLLDGEHGKRASTTWSAKATSPG